ncbi:helix-turn-helix domain-containing protein, partial [Escherichia coli]|uniref:helix-turn-helix domain-containing protein n=1 Tax=Escherichia coli TaxID=562 RepID=UPI001FCC9EBC
MLLWIVCRERRLHRTAGHPARQNEPWEASPRTTAEQKKPTEADHTVGNRIAVRRAARGISQTALGQALGVSFQQVQKYEKGRNRVGAGRLQT